MAKEKRKKGRQKESQLEYQVNILFDTRDNIYVARVPELENCHSHGKTPEEALVNAKEAVQLWLETAAKKRIPIPEPINRKKFSGKFVLRTPPKMHATLAQQALQQGKSMNELAVELIDSALKETG